MEENKLKPYLVNYRDPKFPLTAFPEYKSVEAYSEEDARRVFEEKYPDLEFCVSEPQIVPFGPNTKITISGGVSDPMKKYFKPTKAHIKEIIITGDARPIKKQNWIQKLWTYMIMQKK